MISGVHHHCHHISLVWWNACFVQFTKTELFLWSLYIYILEWLGFVIALLMAYLKNEWMCILGKETINVKLINHDCLPIIMLMYTMLYILFAYLMLFAALSNVVCLHSAFFAIDFCKYFFFLLSNGLLIHILFISCINLHHAPCLWSVGVS